MPTPEIILALNSAPDEREARVIDALERLGMGGKLDAPTIAQLAADAAATEAEIRDARRLLEGTT